MNLYEFSVNLSVITNKMKRFIKNPYLYLGAALLMVVALLFTDKTTDDEYIQREEIHMGKELQNHLIEKKSAAFKLFNNKELPAAIERRNLDNPALKAIKKQHFYLICTKNDSLYFWNSNQAFVDSSITNSRDSVGIVKVGLRSFLICKKKIKNFECFLLRHIQLDFGSP